MAYEKYSTEKIFNAEIVNNLCNKILDNIHTEFPGSETKLVATDALAEIIQGQPLTELAVVPFVTNDADIYDYLVRQLRNITGAETQLSFKNRIQLATPYAFFEIWYDITFVSAVNVNGIYCRDLTEL